LEVVERVMTQYRPVSVPGLPRFTGGAVGFIGYEFIHDVEPVVPRPPHDDLQTPVMYFLIADQLLIFDRVAQTLLLLVNAVLEDSATAEEAYENATGEIHVRSEDRRVEIRPIAGTRPRGKDATQDKALQEELLADPKERAEHVMLVDLARNDLGRVCDFGSVQVKDLMIIERYSHVMHIVSQVEGKLSKDNTLYALMRETFPAGTHSCARKIRAMQIISELEQTVRGPYGGCVGYFSFNGNLDCCITIRTALLKDGKAYVQVA